MFKKIKLTMSAMLFCAVCNMAMAYPDKPIKLIIPSVPGGVSDAVGRLFAEEISKELKNPVVPENVPGVGTFMAIKRTLNSEADGYTVPIFANTIVTMPYVDKKSGFKSSDFMAVSYLSKMPLALTVSSNSPFNTLKDLVDYAKKNPLSVSYSSVGIGTTSHLPAELFAQSAGVELQMISYKGSAQAIPDVVSGRVHFMMSNAATAGELIKAGKVKVLATTTKERNEHFPNVPTFNELGYPEVVYELILGLMVKKGTSSEVIGKLSSAAEKVKTYEHVQRRLKELGQDLPVENTPEKFNQFLKNEEQVMSKVVKAANISLN